MVLWLVESGIAAFVFCSFRCCLSPWRCCTAGDAAPTAQVPKPMYVPRQLPKQKDHMAALLPLAPHSAARHCTLQSIGIAEDQLSSLPHPIQPVPAHHPAATKQPARHVADQGPCSAAGRSIAFSNVESASTQTGLDVASGSTLQIATSSSMAVTSMPQNYKVQEEQSLCVICWDRAPSWLCVPCGHLALCKTCSQAVKEKTNVCPMCQQTIQCLHEVFFS